MWSFKKELARKLFHFLSLLIVLGYFLVSDIFDSDVALFVLLFFLIVFIFLEYIRLEFGKNVPLLGKIWGYVRRDSEKNTIGGEVYFFIGAIIALAVFDTQIAVSAILMTTFGDMAAAIIGKRFGKHYVFKDKALEGIFAQFFVNLIVGFVVFFIVPGVALFTLKFWAIIVVMSLTATLTETVITKIDDNLAIPLFAGFDGQITLIVLSALMC